MLDHSRTPRTLTPEAKLSLVLLSARAGEAAQRERLPALAGDTGPDRLGAFLDRQRIAVIAMARMQELGLAQLAGQLTQILGPTVDRAHSMATVQSVLTREVADELEGRGVRAIPLKGVVLADRLYGDPAGRESNDIDILVAPDQLGEAVHIVRERFGYGAPVDVVDARGRPLLHYCLVHPRGWPSIELHWRVHWYEERSGTAMVDRSSLSGGVRRLSAADEAACLLLFYARDAFIGLRNLVAVAAWWDRFGHELPSGGLASFVREFPELGPALATSAAIADTLTGVPRSGFGFSPTSLGVRQRGAARMADVDAARARTQLEADVALVDLLLAPRTEIRTFISRQRQLNASFIAVSGEAEVPWPWMRRALIVPRALRRATRLLRALARALLIGAEGGRSPAAR